MTLTIKNHKIEGIPFISSPNISNGFTPRYLCIHYTANDSYTGAISTLTTPANKVSAHFVLSKKGELTQLCQLDKKAWHIGTSEWKGLTGLNAYAFGIEICNFGPLTLKNEKYYSWNGKEVSGLDVFKDTKGKYWNTYTPDQLKVVWELAKTLVDHYNLIDVIGHEDVCMPRGRKQDPSVAFPMKELRKFLFNREEAL
jgi:N-acetylmuramoyl-L-alanine amidase